MLAILPPKWRRSVPAGIVSLAVHVFVVVPFGVARLLIVPEPAPLEIAYLGDPEAPTQDDAPDPEQPVPLPDRERPKSTPRPEQAPEPQPEDPAKKKPAEEKKKDERPPPLLVIPQAHLKMVDQDQYQEEQDNPDARYLAQKNHRAQKDTEAVDTNLVRNQQGQAASQESARQDPNIGAAERKIAELAEQEGKKDRLPVQGQTGQAGQVQAQSEGSPLALRDQVARSLQTQPERRDGVEVQEQGLGPLPMARSGAEAEHSRAAQSGAQARLKLSHDDYDRLVGYDVAQAERRAAARAEQSHASGRWERVQEKVAMMRSSLENFTGAVRSGNQSELGTRAHPFAGYIAKMHQQIHRFWGFGFLAGLSLRAGSPYNDYTLWTGVEIALKDDGQVDRLVIRHPSGNASFDAAALDAVMSSAPFPPPPAVIKSRDGKVYLDWRFHRDDRQCATDFVEPHILTDPPKGGEAVATTGAARPAPAPKEREPNGGKLLGPLLGGGLAGLGGGRRAGAAATGAGGGGAAAGGAAAGGGAAKGGAVAKGEVPAAAREIADKWLAAYLRGDARWLAGYSAVPFSTGGRTAAEDGESLRSMYRQMLAESPRRSGTLSFFTKDQLLKRLGKLPAGGDEEGTMFAMVRGGPDEMYLLLQEADRGWRVVGLVR